MTRVGLNRRHVGVGALVVGAALTVVGTLVPFYRESRSFTGTAESLALTAWQSVFEPSSPVPGPQFSPQFGFPLVLAAALMVIGAVLTLRPQAQAIGRMAAIAGPAVLLGAAWSVYLYITYLLGFGGSDAPADPRFTQTIGAGMYLLGVAWIVGTLGAVLVQDLPEPAPRPEVLADTDGAVVYQLPDAPSDDVDTPPLGFPVADPDERPGERPPDEQPPDEQPEETRVTLEPLDEEQRNRGS
jgi:hypothetical protein